MRTKRGYWIGGALIALGVLGAIVWLVLSFARLADQIDEFQRVDVPGEATVRFEPQKYIVYVEGDNADEVVPSVSLTITDPDGAPLDIQSYGGSLTYALGEEGSAQGTVTPPRAGDYLVRTEGGGNARVAFGDSIAGSIVRAVLGGLAIGALFLFGGVILLVVTAIRRRRDAGEPPRSPGAVA